MYMPRSLIKREEVSGLDLIERAWHEMGRAAKPFNDSFLNCSISNRKFNYWLLRSSAPLGRTVCETSKFLNWLGLLRIKMYIMPNLMPSEANQTVSGKSFLVLDETCQSPSFVDN